MSILDRTPAPHRPLRITREWSRRTGHIPRLDEVEPQAAHDALVVSGVIDQSRFDEAAQAAMGGRTQTLATPDARFYFERRGWRTDA